MANVKAAELFIAPAAEQLLRRAQAAARQAGYSREKPSRLDIVSHSMGAVSSRWYAARIDPKRVRTWVSLAGANHGSDALCNHTDDGAKDLCPAYAVNVNDSMVQLQLNGTPALPLDETPYGLGMDHDGVKRILPDASKNILYYTVRIEPDKWIKPEKSAVLDGAGGIPFEIPGGITAVQTSAGNLLVHGRLDHDTIMADSDVIRLVTALLVLRDKKSNSTAISR